MSDYKSDFKGKRITVMGLGLLGRGVGDVEFLAQLGAKITVTDMKTAEELHESVKRLHQFSTVSFHFGGHRTEDFTDTDMVIKAAGVPLNSPEIAAAHAAGVPVYMSTALFAKYAMDKGARIVGTTGTRGKTTIAHMIFHVLRSAPRPNSGRERHIFLGGNVRGLSTLAMLPEVHKEDIAVLELDSWQLQGFGELKVSPHIAVFTNLMPDHLNYYPDMDSYFADKANIFRYQKPDDVLITGGSIVEKIREARPPLDPIVPEAIPAKWKLRIPGVHNRENASLAAAALEALGLRDEEIKGGLETFEAVEGRLQFVREVEGVKIYNDNNATTPDATIAALQALGGEIVLITGGSEKGLPLEELVSTIKHKVSHVILLMHENYKGTERLKVALDKAGVPCVETNSLSGALAAALETSSKGNILFSPAFASFGMFKNEYDRNDQFMSLVRNL